MMFFPRKKEKNAEISGPTGLFGLKKYQEIEKILKKFPYNSKFMAELEKTEAECSATIGDSIKMSRKDWEILTILRLFDRQTFEHSVGSFIIVRDKIENASQEGVQIKKGIEKEVGDMEVFYRACLFHDIGKISIPKFVLKNSLTDRDWVLSFYRQVKKSKNKVSLATKKYLKKHNLFHFVDRLAYADSPEEIMNFLKKKNLRPVQVIPLHYGISKRELKRLKKEYGFDGDISLADLMSLHEKESQDILSRLGYEKEALIAGSHGSGGAASNNLSKTYSSVRIGSRMSDIVDLVYLADIQDALQNKRYYHKSFTKLKILSILVRDMQKGLVDKNISYLWIEDEYRKLKKDKDFVKNIQKIKSKEEDSLDTDERDIKKEVDNIEKFLSSICVIPH